jgi:hypothetical protein
MALFGANLGVDSHTGYTPKAPKQQYLNSQGWVVWSACLAITDVCYSLFTQTTPKANPLQGQDSVMSIDDESMPFQQTAPISSEEPLLEPTYRSIHASSHQDDPEALDATPAAPLSRLKRRREQEDEEEEEPPQDQAEESETDLPMEDALEEEQDVAVPSSQPEPTFRPEPTKLDVLQRMMAAARSPPKAGRPRVLPGVAKEFLENEAELDLEEDGFYNRLDDEDDDAEGDGVVENLVDDAARTKEQEIEDARRRAEIDRYVDMFCLGTPADPFPAENTPKRKMPEGKRLPKRSSRENTRANGVTASTECSAVTTKMTTTNARPGKSGAKSWTDAHGNLMQIWRS